MNNEQFEDEQIERDNAGKVERDALDHILRVCDSSREQSRRIRWIRKRCHHALGGISYNPEDFDMPRASGNSASLARSELASMKAERDAFKAESAELAASIELEDASNHYREQQLKAHLAEAITLIDQHYNDLGDACCAFQCQHDVDVVSRFLDVLQVFLARVTQAADGEPMVKYRERSNHDVIRREQSQPCYCWAENEHRIGEEVPAAPAAAHGDSFQARVQPWMLECFGEAIAGDRKERNHRFLEEALELVQSTGCTASEAHQLVDYVFGRPVGEPDQEVGGVMLTLAALCLANGQDMHAAAEVELARIWTKVEAIRAKQAAKPKNSPLPLAAAHEAVQSHAGMVGLYNTAQDEIDAVRKDAERYRHLRGITEGLDTTVDAMIAEDAAMRAGNQKRADKHE